MKALILTGIKHNRTQLKILKTYFTINVNWVLTEVNINPKLVLMLANYLKPQMLDVIATD